MPPWSLLPGSHTSRQLELELSVNADKITAYIRTQATGGLLVGHTETIQSRKKKDVPSLCPRSGAVLYTLQLPGHASPHKAGEAQPRTKMEINYLVSAWPVLAVLAGQISATCESRERMVSTLHTVYKLQVYPGQYPSAEV